MERGCEDYMGEGVGETKKEGKGGSTEWNILECHIILGGSHYESGRYAKDCLFFRLWI